MTNKIWLMPGDVGENSYIKVIREDLLARGINCNPFSYGVFLKRAFSGDIVFCNWYENNAVRKGSLGVIQILVFCLICRFLKFKLIWLRHNRIPHQVFGYRKYTALIACYFLAKLSFKYLSHGLKYAHEHGIEWVAHPLYFRSFDEGITGDYYVCFGRMMKYKKIEDILLAWSPGRHLYLCGKFERNYREVCEKIAQERKLKVSIIDRFISDDELKTIVSNAKGVVVANDGGSAIISGVIFYAFSLGMKVYLVNDLMESEVGFHYKGVYQIKSMQNNSPSLVSKSNIYESARFVYEKNGIGPYLANLAVRGKNARMYN
tara:strand:+ start:8734 stop:9687 length:954 start_codon:yes stop_codon:yes gene_type:complete